MVAKGTEVSSYRDNPANKKKTAAKEAKQLTY
jgi:hypothetical protein